MKGRRTESETVNTDEGSCGKVEENEKKKFENTEEVPKEIKYFKATM